MNGYKVSIELNGCQKEVGVLEPCSEGFCFRYDRSYIEDPLTSPISVSLPFQDEPFSSEQTGRFFEGLLPEGFIRRSVAQMMHVDENDYMSILAGLGRECLGAIRITGEDDDITESYTEVTQDQIRALAEEGATKSAEIVTASHLSLTGASGKVGLYYDSGNNKWYQPQGTAPSTHIVKQSHVRLNDIVTNEQLVMMTALACGIAVPESFIINTGSGNDGEILFAARRYDRIFSDRGRYISALPVPDRLHQEDFAQAMGISSARKYEKTPGQYMTGMFEILRKYSSDPIRDRIRLWNMIVFDCLIGNTDAHVKNFALIYSPNLRSIKLAPAYDMLSTVIYESSTHELSFAIGDALTIEEAGEENFMIAAKNAGIGEKLALLSYRQMKKRIPGALRQSAEKLLAAGFKKAGDLAEMILEKTCF